MTECIGNLHIAALHIVPFLMSKLPTANYLGVVPRHFQLLLTWMDGWMRTSVLGSDPSLRIIHWPLIPPRSHWVQRFGQSDSSK